MRTRIFLKFSSLSTCGFVAQLVSVWNGLEYGRILNFFFQAFYLHFLYCISFVKIIASPPKKNVKNNFTNLQTSRGEGQPLAQMFSTVLSYVSQGF